MSSPFPFRHFLQILILCLFLSACKKSQEAGKTSVKEVVDGVVTRLYKDLTAQQLDTISEKYILSFLTEEERQVLATKFLTFDVDAPVTVSLMRDSGQKVVPFWIAESGFKKTEMVVKNEMTVYEVWQKDFDKGEIGLGINGFDKNRPVYFITVGPKNKGETVKISHVYPEKYPLDTMKTGAFIYHDWDSLVFSEVPASLVGQTLFTTVRGRAREAHLVGAFRKTLFPSSENPDQIMLTWSGDPKTSVDIQWRTAIGVKEGLVKYWQENTKDTLSEVAWGFEMEDRLLQNDRYVNRYTAKLNGLKPGTDYTYVVGSKSGKWSTPSVFKTEPASDNGFSFIWFGDTHKSQIWGDMAQKALQRHPETAFFDIAGDLVSTGLHRDEWDELWKYSGDVFRSRPLMPVPGNHDSQDGLGAWMYQEMFSLPKNGPEKIDPEMTYAFNYQDALFLMMDPTQSVPAQTSWMEEKLKTSKAKWKFVFFHFPPYNFVEPYDEIMKEWCTLFDKYHVDMVMNGHMHYYLRTKPMFNGKAVATPAQGTIYTMSISIPGKQEEWPDEAYAVTRYQDGPLYQHITMKGNTLLFKCYDPEGNIKDAFTIVK